MRFCQLSTPSLPPSKQQQQPCGKQVQSCHSNGRLQQEETGLNRSEQLPTATQPSLRIHCATPQYRPTYYTATTYQRAYSEQKLQQFLHFKRQSFDFIKIIFFYRYHFMSYHVCLRAELVYSFHYYYYRNGINVTFLNCLGFLPLFCTKKCTK